MKWISRRYSIYEYETRKELVLCFVRMKKLDKEDLGEERAVVGEGAKT
jgi:hypothetical protein